MNGPIDDDFASSLIVSPAAPGVTTQLSSLGHSQSSPKKDLLVAGRSSTYDASLQVEETDAGDAEKEAWDQFFQRADMVPLPKKDTSLLDITTKAKSLFAEEDDCYWDKLSGAEQGKLAFLIMKKQTKRLKKRFPREVKVKITKALKNRRSFEFRHTQSLVQKGGDFTVLWTGNGDDKTVRELWNDYVQQLTDSEKEGLICVFDLNPTVDCPFRVQAKGSNVCTLVTAANGVSIARQCRSTTATPVLDEGGDTNVRKLMRYTLSKNEIFDMIFCDKGTQITTALDRMLESGSKNPVWGANELPDGTVKQLRCGTVLLQNFRIFEEFRQDTTKLFFHAEENITWSKDSHNNDVVLYHALNVVSIQETPGKFGGYVFDVLDSYRERPFFRVGLDLLREMNADLGHFIRTRVDCTKIGYPLEGKVAQTVSGDTPRHPRHSEDAGEDSAIRRLEFEFHVQEEPSDESESDSDDDSDEEPFYYEQDPEIVKRETACWYGPGAFPNAAGKKISTIIS